jgi:heme ABC exporter ATP-binding subunit CcmA
MPSGQTATLDRVSKLYGSLAALWQISLTLESGVGYLILGENGAGKSTLLRVLAGLAEPTSGSVKIFGDSPQQVRAQIGYMSHETMLYDELTAAENLRYYATLYPLGSSSTAQCMSPEEALAAVSLPASLERPVGKYSQGMRQRVSLARVLMTRPSLLLLDEPFSNMDRASAVQMVALLQRLRQDGRTVVITTHQPELAQPLADITLQMQAGQLVTREGAAA